MRISSDELALIQAVQNAFEEMGYNVAAIDIDVNDRTLSVEWTE